MSKPRYVKPISVFERIAIEHSNKFNSFGRVQEMRAEDLLDQVYYWCEWRQIQHSLEVVSALEKEVNMDFNKGYVKAIADLEDFLDDIAYKSQEQEKEQI